jgi:ectoine hydroxylase
MSTLVDHYPSRAGDTPSMTERREPVLHHPSGVEAPGPASREALAEFERDGFMVLDAVFSAGEVAAFRDELQALADDPAVRASEEAITEPGSGALRSLFAVHRSSEIFADLAADDRLVEVAEQILASRAYVHQSRVNLKPALHGQPFFWHSDFETWHAEDGMPSMRAVSASVALTDNTEFNGPLMLVPGSHRWFVSCVGETPDDHYRSSLKQQEVGTPDVDSLRELVERGGIVAPKATTGSVIVFDCNTMHASGVNLAPYPRCNAFFVYNSVENEPQEPFGAATRRPEFLASRTVTPLH